MKETKCQLDWDDRRYTLQVNSQTITGTSYDSPRQMAEVAKDSLPLTVGVQEASRAQKLVYRTVYQVRRGRQPIVSDNHNWGAIFLET